MFVNRSVLRWTLLVVASLVTATEITAGPKVHVGRSAASDQRKSMDQIDHSSWSALLGKYVDGTGRVNYAGWKNSPGDRAVLDAYLNELSRADARIQTSREGYLAFWINAYNAVTIKGILREYPTTSIRKPARAMPSTGDPSKQVTRLSSASNCAV